MTTDTEALIYPERVNALNGEPGGGKTWVALQACVEMIAAGCHVIFVDLEDHATSTIARMRALGATDEDLRERFHYVKPDRPMSPEAMEYLEAKVVELEVALVVIDSVGELMSLQGVKPNDDDAVAALYRAIPRRFASLGPAVLLIDHVPKNNADTPLYAIGSQRKRAAIDGASFMVATVKGFAAGTDGMLKLVTAKDRLGNFVTGQAAALVNVTSAPDGGSVALAVTEPDVTADGTFRPTQVMERVSAFLAALGGRPATTAEIKEAIGGKDDVRLKALTLLVSEGWAEKQTGPRNAAQYRLLRPFDKLLPAAPAESDDGF